MNELNSQLHDLAFLYTGTEKGNNSGIRFMMTVKDAQTWCSSPISTGVLHGTRWVYFYTSVYNYLTCHWGTKNPTISIQKLKDNGSWDERINDLGLEKIGFNDFAAVLNPLGVKVIK